MALIPSALSPVSNSIDRVFPDKWMIRLQETPYSFGNVR